MPFRGRWCSYLAEHVVAKSDLGVLPVNIARQSSFRLEQQSGENLVPVGGRDGQGGASDTKG